MAEARLQVIPRFVLQSGQEVRDLGLRYTVHGTLDAGRTNAILFPTWFAGTGEANRWIIGPGRGLDTDRFCVIVVDALGNGRSSSPSNHAQLAQASISLLDNVRAQQTLVEALGVKRLHAVVGRSMGAQQALQWACWFPDAMERVFAFCGTPATTPHNRLLLDAMAAVLRSPLATEAALEQAARIYAPWVMSHEFFNERGFTAEEVETWVRQAILPAFRVFDPRDLLCLVRTWQQADIAQNDRFAGDLRAALRAIRARVRLVPISHDLIFPPEDFKMAQQLIPRCSTRSLHSTWGHRAGAPGSLPRDIEFLEDELRDFLAPCGDRSWQLVARMGTAHPL